MFVILILFTFFEFLRLKMINNNVPVKIDISVNINSHSADKGLECLKEVLTLMQEKSWQEMVPSAKNFIRQWSIIRQG